MVGETDGLVQSLLSPGPSPSSATATATVRWPTATDTATDTDATAATAAAAQEARGPRPAAQGGAHDGASAPGFAQVRVRGRVR